MKLLASLLTAAIFAAPAFPAFSAGETPVKADAAKGQASYGAVCASCHAVDGNSSVPLQPKLAGQHPSIWSSSCASSRTESATTRDEGLCLFAQRRRHAEYCRLVAHAGSQERFSKEKIWSLWASASIVAAFRIVRLLLAPAATAPMVQACRPSTRVFRASMPITR